MNDCQDMAFMFPPGVIFRPTDGELLKHYLKKKIENESLPPNPIHTLNFYDFGPHFLAGTYVTLFQYLLPLICVGYFDFCDAFQ